MLLQIGQKHQSPKDLVGLLLECHERIRTFIGLARAVGERSDLPEAEVLDLCSRVERYFTDALPLHVADEEQSILPRLEGQSAPLDQTLRTMREQHATHEPKLQALLRASSQVRENPNHPARRDRLRTTAIELEREFAEHLALEENLLFPAVRRILPPTQALIVQELRARRAR